MVNQPAAMRPQTKWALGAGALAVVALTATLWGGATVANALDKASAQASFGALASSSPAAPIDFDPGALGQNGVLPETVRALGKFKGVDFFIAKDKMENVCLISHERRTNVSASSCTPASAITDSALMLGVWHHQTGGFDAALVPDSFAQGKTPEGWTRVAGNLLTIDSASPTKLTVALEGKDGIGINLRRSQDHNALTGAPER